MTLTRAPKKYPKLQETLQTPEGLWRVARTLAARTFWTFAPAIRALIYRETEVVPTMAVDKYYRCYVNPQFTMWLAEQARQVNKENPCKLCGATKHHHLAYIAGVICHEAQHPARQHNVRAANYMADPKLWNVAADLEINDDLLEIFEEEAKETRARHESMPKLCLPDFVVTPKLFREETKDFDVEFPDDRIAEFYYSELLSLREQLPPQEGKGEGQDGGEGGEGKLGDLMNNNGQDCGSGAHNGQEEWDEGLPDGEQPGISEAEGRQIEREIAKEVKKAAATRGNVPGGLQRWAEEVLAPPVVDWRKVLQKEVRTAINRAFGYDWRSWSRFSRATSATGYKFLFPSRFSPKPRVGIVLDTSGSMGYGENSPLFRAYSETQGVCDSLGAEVVFCAVDAAAGEIQEIYSFKEATVQGGGGTDMRVGIAALQQYHNKPDVVIVLTDGYTPWPDTKPREFPVVAAICGDNLEHGAKGVPDFISTVLVDFDTEK